MSRVWSLYQSSVGKKVVMALTGAVLVGFVIAHLAGNLKLYQGPVKFDHYARFLREIGSPVLGHGQLLWILRIILLACVLLHVLAAVQLTRMSWKARPQAYTKTNDLSFSYASRTMRWGGVIVFGFVLYHLLHFTFGTVHSGFDPSSAYRTVVAGFQVWPVSLCYVLCMIPLGLHLYHGVWSITQTLALDHPTILRSRRPVAAIVAVTVTLGNISFPLAVLAGLVK